MDWRALDRLAQNRQLDTGYRAQTPGFSEYASQARQDLFPTPAHFLATTQIPVLTDAAGLAADIGMYRDQPEERDWLNYALTGLGVLPFVPGMTVFHGTRHRWGAEPGFPEGRARLDKLGTGQGDLAEGPGVYFSEDPGTASIFAEKSLPSPGGGSLFDQALQWIASEGAGKESKNRFISNLQWADRHFDRPVTSTGEASKLLDSASRAWDKQAQGIYSLDLPDEDINRLIDLGDSPSDPMGAYRDLIDLPGADPATISRELLRRGYPGARFSDPLHGRSYVIWDQNLLNKMPVLGLE